MSKKATNNQSAWSVTRRQLLQASSVVAAAGMFSSAYGATRKAEGLKLGMSVAYEGLPSYQRLIQGAKDALAIDKKNQLSIVSCDYDVKKQNDQINTFIATNVDAIIVTPANPQGSKRAIQSALKAKIPVFLAMTAVDGVPVTSVSIADEFSVGLASAKYLVERLKGEGDIGLMTLPANDSWKQRTDGLNFILRQYPKIKVIDEWPFDATLKVSARDAASAMLSKNPSLKAIWTAWDDAGIQAALAAKAAGRDIFTTGVDGGEQPFQYIAEGTAFECSIGISYYQHGYYAVNFAQQFLAGNSVPFLVITPSYTVTKKALESSKKDNWKDWDAFGRAEGWGWHRSA